MSTPVLQALLVADQIYKDATTGKSVICGVFHRIFIRNPQTHVNPEDAGQTEEGITEATMPIEHLRRAGSPYCYISLTELNAQKTLELRFVDLKTMNVLFNANLSVCCDDPLKVIELIVPLPNFNVTGEGEYSLELLCDNELLGSHRLKIEVAN